MTYQGLYFGFDRSHILIKILLGQLLSIFKDSFIKTHYTSQKVGIHTNLTHEHQDYQQTFVAKNDILFLVFKHK